MARALTPLDCGSYKITESPGAFLSFAESGSPDEVPTGAHSFSGRLETADVRVRMDGTDATSTEGELIPAGGPVLLDFNMIAKASFVRKSGTDGVIKGHWYQNEILPIVGLNTIVTEGAFVNGKTDDDALATVTGYEVDAF